MREKEKNANRDVMNSELNAERRVLCSSVRAISSLVFVLRLFSPAMLAVCNVFTLLVS